MNDSLLGKDVGLLPVAQSTPKRKRTNSSNRNVFICPVCDKTYHVKFYFDRHVESHPSQGFADTTGDGTLNVSDLTINSSNIFKVPATPKRAKPKPSSSQKTLNPSCGKKKVAAQKIKSFRCTYCPNAYVTESLMKKHIRVHTMQVAAARFPDTKDIEANAVSIGADALTTVSNCPAYGPNGQQFRELIGHVVSLINFGDFSLKVVKEIVSAVANKKTLLPSALMKTLYDKMETVLNDDDFCDSCVQILEISSFEGDVQSQFMLEFFLCVTSGIFTFISKTYRGHFPRAVRAMPELDGEDKQVIYYVAGSVMRGYLRMAYRCSRSLKWKEICGALKSHVLCTQPVGDIDAQWTRDIDRGGLLYINMECQKFFISLTKLIFQNEKKDGSIDYDLFLKLVTECHISVLWDNVFKDSLPESMSVDFMCNVVSSFCKACGRGIARKRLNALREKPVISMPIRHAVASRKNK